MLKVCGVDSNMFGSFSHLPANNALEPESPFLQLPHFFNNKLDNDKG
jgi:hypothetical protein